MLTIGAYLNAIQNFYAQLLTEFRHTELSLHSPISHPDTSFLFRKVPMPMCKSRIPVFDPLCFRFSAADIQCRHGERITAGYLNHGFIWRYRRWSHVFDEGLVGPVGGHGWRVTPARGGRYRGRRHRQIRRALHLRPGHPVWRGFPLRLRWRHRHRRR